MPSLPGWVFDLPTKLKVAPVVYSSFVPVSFGQVHSGLSQTWRQLRYGAPRKQGWSRPRDGSSIKSSSISRSTYWTRRSCYDLGSSYRVPTSNLWSREDFHAVTPVPNTVKFSIDKSPPKRVQPAKSTGTQSGEGINNVNEVSPPIVGRLGASREAGSYHQRCEPRSITGLLFSLIINVVIGRRNSIYSAIGPVRLMSEPPSSIVLRLCKFPS